MRALKIPIKSQAPTTKCGLEFLFMGASVGHPIMKRWKELIRERWDMVNNTHSSPIERVINHTYFPFTFAFFDTYQEQNLTNIVLPTTYFYPLAPAQASKRRSSVRSIREKLYGLCPRPSFTKNKTLFSPLARDDCGSLLG